MDFASPTQTKTSRKHVSKACLECRRRHFKCDGQTPTCARCNSHNIECVYVSSNRGGARRKGASSKIKDEPKAKLFDMEDAVSLTRPTTKTSNIRDSANLGLDKLPCNKDNQCKTLDCAARDTFNRKVKDVDSLSESARKKLKVDISLQNLNCVFAPKQEDDNQNEGDYNNLNFLPKILNEKNKSSLDFNAETILFNYYTKFHDSHPVLPPKEEIELYLANPLLRMELLFIMKVIGDGQTGSIYSKNSDLVSDRLIQLTQIISSSPNFPDAISLQVLVLISLVAHVSSLHDFSRNIRRFSIHLIDQLKINLLDDNGSSILESPRLSHIPKELVYENARRTFWELYFFDVIVGSADGITLTKFTKFSTKINYPSYPSRDQFDYKSRSETSKLVTLAIVMNNEIKNKQPHDLLLKKLRAELSSWELKFADPTTFAQPELVHKDGTVNDGIQQAILMFNYAKIFAHRPFSFLWKTNAPQNPRCDDNALEADDLPTQLKADAKATIETIKTIDAANSILGLLMDTNSANILERTPLFACALALTSLVYTSAFIWVESIVELGDPELIKNSRLGEKELEIYGEYIKLSLSAIYPISKHWTLSGRLASHVRNTLEILRPNLYSKMKDSLPQIEISIEKMDLNSGDQKANQIDGISPSSISSASSDRDSVRSDNHKLSEVPSRSSNATSNMFDTEISCIDSIGGDNNMNGVMYAQNMDTNDVFDPLQLGDMISDTGCNWIDKALLDYFVD